MGTFPKLVAHSFIVIKQKEIQTKVEIGGANTLKISKYGKARKLYLFEARG